MSYSKLLKDIIAQTNYTQEELAIQCTNLGIKTRREDINNLLKNRKKPNEKISRAISKICGVDERLLVLEGYLENAPKELLEVLTILKTLTNTLTLSTSSNMKIVTREQLKEIETIIKNQSLSSFLINILDLNPKALEFINNGLAFKETLAGKNYSFSLPIGLQVNDNGMSPLIAEGDKILIDFKSFYDTGDIVAYTLKTEKKEEKTLHIRTLSRINSTFVMSPLNSNYTKEIYNDEDIIILGKVRNIIKEI